MHYGNCFSIQEGGLEGLTDWIRRISKQVILRMSISNQGYVDRDVTRTYHKIIRTLLEQGCMLSIHNMTLQYVT